MTALLSNDLMTAVTRADTVNLPRLPDYAAFLISTAPVGSFGSAAAFKEWLRTGGVVGRQRAREAARSEQES